MEKEIKVRSAKEEGLGRKYKKKRLNELSSEEINEIVRCYLTETLTQEEVAQKFRISSVLMSKLYCLHKKDQDNQNQRLVLPARMKKEKEDKRQKAQELIKASMNKILQDG